MKIWADLLRQPAEPTSANNSQIVLNVKAYIIFAFPVGPTYQYPPVTVTAGSSRGVQNYYKMQKLFKYI